MTSVRITKIDKTPEVSLNDYPEVSGLCRAIGADGTEHTLKFVREGNSGRDAIDLFWVEDDSAQAALDDEDYEAISVAVVDAIDEIEAAATDAAEQAWNEVWINEAVKAESEK